jgi:peptide/nickel transport system substrate-binding protein
MRVNTMRVNTMRVCAAIIALALPAAAMAQPGTARAVGGELAYGERPTIGSLNPYGSPVSDAPTDRFLSLLYEPLFRWNFLTEEAEPVLAVKARPTPPSKGAKSAFIIDLKPGVRWHDSTQFTANDVEFTYRYIRDKGQNRNLRSAINELVFSVKAIKQNQVLFEFKQLVTDPALVLTQPIIPASRFVATMEPTDANKSLSYYPVGTGPYRQIGEPKKNLELSLYRAYHDSVGKIQTIRSRVFNDPTNMVESMLSTGGDINMIVEVPDEQLKRVEGSKPRIKNAKLEAYKVHAIAIRQRPGSPLMNARLRRAITSAINREQIRANWFVGRGEILPGPFTPGSPYWDASLKPLPFDSVAAKKEIAAAGFAGKTINLIYKTADLDAKSLESDLARTVQQALGAVGLKVTATGKSPNQFQESIFNNAGEWDMAVVRLEFNAVYDISDYFHSRNIKPGGYNFMRFANAQVDRLLDDASNTDEPSRKRSLTMQAGRIIRDSVPAVFIVNEETVYAYTSDLIIPDGSTDGFYFFTYANQWYFRPRGGR